MARSTQADTETDWANWIIRAKRYDDRLSARDVGR